MSRNTNAKIIAHCKVCQDAGKPEAIYRSHFTRENKDPNSKVTCPTLLALECRYCYKKGHTVKYCSVLKQKDSRQQVKPAAPKAVTAVAVAKPNNPYACLDSDSEEEDQKVSIKPVESFPQLCVPVKNQYQGSNYSSNYAAALLKPQAKAEQKPAPAPVADNSAPKLAPWVTSAKPETILVAALPPPMMRNPRRCWADDSDSDSEDEEEDKNKKQETAAIAILKDLKIVVPVLDEDW
jgi:hypothetical protein